MKSSVIIEASDRLGWQRRLASEASTAALWGGWLWLWTPLLKSAAPLAHVSAWGLPGLASPGTSLPLSLAAVAGTSGTLVAWRKLPRKRAAAVKELPVSEYARRFGLGEQVIEDARRAAVCVVHHHPDGRIATIECREPADGAPA